VPQPFSTESCVPKLNPLTQSTQLHPLPGFPIRVAEGKPGLC